MREISTLKTFLHTYECETPILSDGLQISDDTLQLIYNKCQLLKDFHFQIKCFVSSKKQMFEYNTYMQNEF